MENCNSMICTSSNKEASGYIIKEKLCNGQPIRAAIYVKNTGEQGSCKGQIDQARAFLKAYPNIVFRGVYADRELYYGKFHPYQYGRLQLNLKKDNLQLVIVKNLSILALDFDPTFFVFQMFLALSHATVYTMDDNQIHDFESANKTLQYFRDYPDENDYSYLYQ